MGYEGDPTKLYLCKPLTLAEIMQKGGKYPKVDILWNPAPNETSYHLANT